MWTFGRAPNNKEVKQTKYVLLTIIMTIYGVADTICVIRSPCNIAIILTSEFFTHILVFF
jgi:hypothetical protein